MNRYNFKGDLNAVSERQLAYISEVLEQNGVKGTDVFLDPVGKSGDNYTANVKRITVKKNGETVKLFAKVAPIHKKMREMTNTTMLFRNEHVIYTEILEKFDQLQIEAGVSKEEIFRHPKFYGSLPEEPNEVILLEDLKESKFDMVDRLKPISTECVKIALKNFAKFHSFSYVLKTLEPETYVEMKSKLGEMMSEHWNLIDELKPFYPNLEKMTMNCMSNEKYKNAIEGTVSETLNLGIKCIQSDRNSRFSVINQGDAWTNNIMFRIENDVPEECILIDYQLAYEASPAYDIMHMVFNSTDHEQRMKHYHDFIDLYHSELDKSLNNFGLKANMVYPRDQLDADLKRYGKFAFGLSVMVAYMSLKTPEEAELFQKSAEKGVENPDDLDELFAQKSKTMLLFKKRIEDLVDSFLEFELLSGFDL